MTGLKSGSGDDLWGDSGDATDDESEPEDPDERDAAEAVAEAERRGDGAETGRKPESESESESESASESESEAATDAVRTSAVDDAGNVGRDEGGENDSVEVARGSASRQPYIVRRAIRDKSVQFERDERLTFFVHDDVADGERDLITDLESELGRSLPKFDVREAVYRAALRNREDVLRELLAMGYAADES